MKCHAGKGLQLIEKKLGEGGVPRDRDKLYNTTTYVLRERSPDRESSSAVKELAFQGILKKSLISQPKTS